MPVTRIVHAFFIFIFILALMTAGCADKKSTSVQPPKDVRQSFNVINAMPHNDSNLKIDKYLVGIRKSSLEKEFLLRSQMVSQDVVAGFQGLRSRIVAFRHHDDEILMLEATQGHMVDTQTPAALLLAKFKVVKETDDILYFDINQGLSDLYMTGDWYASDFAGQRSNDSSLFRSVPLQASYIEEANFDSTNQLVVSQVGLLRASVNSTYTTNRPIRTKFYLSSYNPDLTFEKSKSYADFSQFGYFEIYPQFANHGWSEIYVSKFNIHSPIEYAISANTPAEFKDSVRDGILYWNKAFGRDVLKVTDAPQGVSAPDSQLNIVQWIKWDWAGGAYADAQMDPRTGQILNAQIFMTSVFAITGKDVARRLLRTYGESKKNGLTLGLKGFVPSTLCHKTIDASFADQLTEMVTNPTVTDQDILRVAQDYVRNVVAHEVGHTLGLRHNFAGSTAANYRLSDKNTIFADYLTQDRLAADLITTSSVMEYSDFIDAAMSGRQIKKQNEALPYDERAIRHIYDGVTYSRNEAPLYCTDSAASKFLDCSTFDTGPSVVESVYRTQINWNELLIERLLNAFVVSKSPAPNDREVPVERVTLDIYSLIDSLISSQMTILKTLEKDSRLLSTEHTYPVVDSVNSDEAQSKKMEAIAQDIDRLGGLETLLAPWTETDLQNQIEKLDKMINSGSVDKGLDRYDRPYQFTSTELVVIHQRIQDALTAIYNKLPEREMKALSEWTTELSDHSATDAYADVLKDRIEQILFTTSEKTISGTVRFKDGKKSTVTLPIFKYKHSLRESAYALLKRKAVPRMGWAFTQKKAIKDRFKKLLTDELTENWDEITTTGMSSDLLRWYLENREIFSAMKSDDSTTSDSTPDKKSKKSKKTKK